VNYGVAFARKFKARLLLLHVVEAPAALLYVFPHEAATIQAQRQEQAERMLQAFVAPEDEDDLDVVCIVRTGSIDTEIESVIRDQHVDAVVMGTHGRGFFGRMLLGSVTRRLLRKLTVPVFTVCQVYRPLGFKRILYATDLFSDADAGFDFALDIAAATGSSLTVAHVVDTRSLLTYETPDVRQLLETVHRRVLTDAHEKLEQLHVKGRQRGVRVDPLVVEGDPTDTIIHIAEDHEVDFIILGVRKKAALARALLGSTAEPVIRAAHVPVLSFPISVEAKDQDTGVAASTIQDDLSRQNSGG
jgi:nucleotide-binding universal stress UspA family protein